MEGFLGFRAGRWDAAVLAAFGKAARRAPRPRGRGGAPGTGRNSDMRNVGTLSRSGRNDRLPVGRSAESVAGQDGSGSERRQPKGSRKAGAYMAGPSRHGRARITGRIPGLRARARKGADVS